MSLVDSLLLEPCPFDIWIAWRTDPAGGSGTLNDPYDSSTQAKFDSVMSTKVGPNTRARLGPGTFQTRGYSDEVSGGWQIQAGTKIIGSGIDVTTLQVVDAQTGGTVARVRQEAREQVTRSLGQNPPVSVCGKDQPESPRAGLALRACGHLTCPPTRG